LQGLAAWKRSTQQFAITGIIANAQALLVGVADGENEIADSLVFDHGADFLLKNIADDYSVIDYIFNMRCQYSDINSLCREAHSLYNPQLIEDEITISLSSPTSSTLSSFISTDSSASSASSQLRVNPKYSHNVECSRERNCSHDNVIISYDEHRPASQCQQARIANTIISTAAAFTRSLFRNLSKVHVDI